ncbi:MAG: translation initiation factor IF-2 [Desulfovibrio sp.]|jgi:translation initiation factor IF-2|nr:translation initiation factor IF-2 [Desulfovibrio sp.]
MAEEKIPVRDIVTELDVPSRDVLKAMRGLGLPAKTTAGSLSPEDAERLRDHFASRKGEALEKSAGQPNVIVRRRRKDQPAEQPDAKAGAEGAKKPAPEAGKAEPEKAGASQADTAKSDAAKSPQPRAEQEAKPREPRAQKSRKSQKPIATPGARIISRPDDIRKDEVKAAKEALETNIKPLAPTPPKEKPVPQKTLAQEIRERDAARARAEEELARATAELERNLARKAREQEEAQKQESAPAEAVSPAVEDEKQAPAQEKNAKARSARPDASAMPEGSSAPSLPSRGHEAKSKTEEAEKKDELPRVRVISRPQAPAARVARPAPNSSGKGQEKAARQGGKPGGGGFRPQTPRPTASAAPMPQNGAPMQPSLEVRDGQSKKKRLKGRRTVDFQQGDFGRHPEEEESRRFNRGKRRKPAKAPVPQPVTQPIKAAKRKIRVAEAIRVADMAHQMGLKANEIIKVLLGLGVMASINQSLDIDTATLVAAEFDYEVEKAGFSEEDYLAPQETDAPESLKSRPPVVTIMGHVDHGKTSLLDAVRKSNITSGEAGGITQHIGAYHVRTKRGEIVFLDTPGHEAFTAMRARGAQVTDLVILVVAADDGVMEQTREAINHSRAANVPIVVAVNKMDKPGADPDRVLRELAELGLQPEDWGGDTIVARVSAKTREGLDELLELVALQSEIMDLKANPDKPARGHIVEARLDKGRGAVATVLVQEGTLKMGDNFVCGPFYGRVRALTNDQGKKVKEAGPSLPVEVQGFEGVPEAGEEFLVVADDKLARRIADSRAIKIRERDLAHESRVTLETFLAHANDEEALTLNLVLKADVQGSLEAITEALLKQSTDKVKIHIVHGGTGAISESDIMLASASRAIIIGFNVRPTARIKDIAERENVDIRFYDIIYKLVDDIKNAMAGLLAPVQKEVYLGQAEIRQIFHLPKIGNIAGSYVMDGKITRNAGVRLLRDGVVVYTGKIASLKRHKDDAREVVKGNECGIGLENFNDIKEGDLIEAFETVEEAATL